MFRIDEYIEKLKSIGEFSDTEENIKIHITRWLLKELGYDENTFDYEHQLCRNSKSDRRADIFIPVTEGDSLFVETKKYSKNLEDDDVFQLASYISLHNEISWGILTNGRQIFLLNNGIQVEGNHDNNLMDKLFF